MLEVMEEQIERRLMSQSIVDATDFRLPFMKAMGGRGTAVGHLLVSSPTETGRIES